MFNKDGFSLNITTIHATKCSKEMILNPAGTLNYDDASSSPPMLLRLCLQRLTRKINHVIYPREVNYYIEPTIDESSTK